MRLRGMRATTARRMAETVALWQARRRSRAELAQLSEHMLKDIGLTPGQAIFEAGKPFWRA